MAPESQHKKLHNQILISKLLQCKDGVSPVTLVFDSLHQSGKPLLCEIISKAKAAKVTIIFVSLETIGRKGLEKTDHFLQCYDTSEVQIQNAVQSVISKDRPTLVIFDTIHPLINSKGFSPATFLSTFMGPSTSVVLLCHKDIPFSTHDDFAPQPLALLRYLATAILTVHSLSHTIAKKQARDRSIAEPAFGLDEGVEGVLVGMGSNYRDGTVIEMEHRRKSGRTVKEWFFIYHTAQKSTSNVVGPKTGQKSMESVIQLEDHPLYPRPAEGQRQDDTKDEGGNTFNLGLTEKERIDRDAVQLPYFDAQNESGVGAGGRILYDMGVEDDFDEEEDEI